MVMLLILLAGVFLVTSCSNPSDGRDGLTIPGGTGANGADGGFYVTAAAITAPELALLFERAGAGTVVLANLGGVTIDGVIPVGKSLRVATGGDVTVYPGRNLVVNGTLVIEEEATLRAAGTAASGYLVAGGSITGPAGFVFLPVILDDSTIEFDLDGDGEYESVAVDYTSDIGAVTVASSTYESGTATAITLPAQVTRIFNETAITDLRVYSLANIVSETIPNANSKLTLLSSGSTIATATPFEPVGTLIVEEDLTASATTVIVPISGGKIIIAEDGVLSLAAGNTIDTTAGKGVVENNGVISTATTTLLTLQELLTLDGTGTIETTANVTITGTATQVLNKQNLEIASGSTIIAPVVTGTTPIFSTTGGKKVTIADGGTLDLGAIDFTTVPIGVDIVNNGTIETTITDDTILAALFLKVKGQITTGNITGLTVDLSIPADVYALFPVGATFAAGDVNVSVAAGGYADFPGATFAGIITATKSIIINGNADFGGNIAAVGNITVNGNAVTYGGVTYANTFEGTIAGNTITISGDAVFEGVVTPVENVILNPNATLKIEAGGSLTVATSKTLTVNQGAKLTLAASDDLDGTGTITATAGTIVVGTTPYNVAAGQVADDFDAAVTALVADVGILGGATINLGTATYSIGTTFPVSGLGVTTAVSDAFTDVLITVANVTLDTDTAFVGTPQVTSHKYSKINVTGASIQLDASKNLELKDAGYTGSTATGGIVTVSGLRLRNDGVTRAADVPAFNIGLATSRAP
jgi:hypothetical protein